MLPTSRASNNRHKKMKAGAHLKVAMTGNQTLGRQTKCKVVEEKRVEQRWAANIEARSFQLSKTGDSVFAEQPYRRGSSRQSNAGSQRHRIFTAKKAFPYQSKKLTLMGSSVAGQCCPQVRYSRQDSAGCSLQRATRIAMHLRVFQSLS